MAAKIKIINSGDFLEVTADGVIDVATSRKLLKEIVNAEHPEEDYKLFVDFRNTKGNLSVSDVYHLAAELVQYGETFRRKVALLVTAGVNFDRASFFETCTHNRGFTINAFTGYEEAMRWILSDEDSPAGDAVPPAIADKSEGK